MSDSKWVITAESNNDILDALVAIGGVLKPHFANLRLSLTPHPGFTAAEFPFTSRDDLPPAALVFADSSAPLNLMQLTLSKPVVSVTVERDGAIRNLTLRIPDNAVEPAVALAINEAVYRALPPSAGLDQLEAILGKQVADFYRSRDATLGRLERLSTKMIEQDVAYRANLDAQHMTRIAALEEEAGRRRAEMQAEFSRKDEELAQRERELAGNLKVLEDRSNTHERRQLRKDLKADITKPEPTQLSHATSRKRIPIRAAFAVGAIVALGVLSLELIGIVTAQNLDWPRLAVAGAGATSFFALLAFYIRWEDAWATRHAAEEFKLKRLGLDVDRASWVVEMALEWKEEKDTPIPDQLVDRLTLNLFREGEREKPLRHPLEDLLGASSAMKVRTPIGTEVSYDRRGIRRISQESDA